MIKKHYKLYLLAGLMILVVLTGIVLSETRHTASLLEQNAKGLFDLMAHWSQGNVVVMIRHAERCDRSDHKCLDGQEGITVPGKEMSLNIGRAFKTLLPLDNTVVYNSPVKRTAQTAFFMFEGHSLDKQWLINDCKKGLYNDIWANKPEGKNMVLVTHSSCFNYLQGPGHKPLINLEIKGSKSYAIAVFLALDKAHKRIHVLGYLYPEDWKQVNIR